MTQAYVAECCAVPYGALTLALMLPHAAPPRALSDLRYQIRAQALKVLEELLKWRAAQHAAFHAAVSGTPSEAVGDPPAPPPELEGVLKLATTHVARALRDPAAPVRTSACLCFSYLLPADLRCLPPEQQQRWLRVFAAATKDGTATVRAAACRILGAYAASAEWKVSSVPRAGCVACRCVGVGG